MTPEEIMAEANDEKMITTIRFEDDGGELEAAFNSQRVLVHPAISDQEEPPDSEYQPFSWSSSENGVHLIQFEYGDGLLTIISDPSIWSSHRIDQHDHAFLLWMLISTDGDLAILQPALRDSLWELMSQHMPEFLQALALLILLMLWNQSQRFGRIEAGADTSNRSLRQHFSATATYLWQHQASQHLLQPLRTKVLRRATLVIPQFALAGEDSARQQELISRHCDMPLNTVSQAFDAPCHQEMMFVETVRLLKQIEKAL
jgi:hypothetical protein